MSTSKRIRPFISWLVLMTVATFSIPGCKTWELDGDKIEAATSEEVRDSRVLDPTTKRFGFSSKARQIERSVGIE